MLTPGELKVGRGGVPGAVGGGGEGMTEGGENVTWRGAAEARPADKKKGKVRAIAMCRRQ